MQYAPRVCTLVLFIFQALVALEPLVSLMSRFGACCSLKIRRLSLRNGHRRGPRCVTQGINTVEPLKKGHLRTEGIVPYSEVVPIGRLFRKSRIMMPNHNLRTENLSAVLCSSGSTIQHPAVGMRAIKSRL